MWLTTFLQHIACLAIVAGMHVVAYLIGLMLLKRQKRGEQLLLDERDLAIAAIEQGRYSPSLEVAFRIADVFGKRLDEVFHWAGTSREAS